MPKGSPPLKESSNRVSASPPKTDTVAKKIVVPKTTTPSPPVIQAQAERNSSPPKTAIIQLKSDSSSPPSNSTRVAAPIAPKNSILQSTVASPPNKISAQVNMFNKNIQNELKVFDHGSETITQNTPITEPLNESKTKNEKLSLSDKDEVVNGNKEVNISKIEVEAVDDKALKGEEWNGVGDKIKKFEKAAEDANRVSRVGSVRGRSRSDARDDPPPTTTFKDNVHFDLHPQPERTTEPTKTETPIERCLPKNNSPNLSTTKWQRSNITQDQEKPVKKPEPQKIIKPEFKPMPSQVDVTIRSPSLGAKIPDQFPSHGTAFRNVASPDVARNNHKFNEDINTQNNFKTCKLKNKEKYSVSKGSSYFTRGSEEIWLVKKKDIEEIEERVLDSFRRAGGSMCARSESMRPSSDSGQGAFAHATMGRNKRQMYARSESLDPQWANARAHTLKRQSSVACTCGHDKKTRPKTAAEPARARSRSHGDDNSQAHVLDKYETLV